MGADMIIVVLPLCNMTDERKSALIKLVDELEGEDIEQFRDLGIVPDDAEPLAIKIELRGYIEQYPEWQEFRDTSGRSCSDYRRNYKKGNTP
jgi:hypothetical protein